ncbi:MAG TPA: carboxypeptidase-like regulatory domain-containing protein [Solirubrobacterales bacterium]|nr:carboxypeptidase-like regulatory domain-containing protein [Solirubrobacterales bacterium]
MLLLLAVPAVCLACGSSAAASPSRYVYEQCDSALPGGGTAAMRFLANPGSALQSENTCAEPGGTIGISLTRASGEISYWEIPGPVVPGGEVESLTITADICTAGQPVLAFAYRAEWSGSCHDEVRTFKESLTQPFSYYLWLGCNPPGGSCAAGPSISAHYLAATEVDPVPPTLTEVAGTLLAGGVLRGRQTLRATGHDRGGGVANISVTVNGLQAAQPATSNCAVAQADNPSVVGTVASAASPCPESAVADWTLDTGAYPFHTGENSVQVCVSDFSTLSDPNTTCSSTYTVDVDDSCVESPVAGGQSLTARFARSHSATETTAYGRTATVKGRLADAAGDPVAGATLCVRSQTVGFGTPALDQVTTDAQGRFSYPVPAGPNREIVVGYRNDTFQVDRDLRLYSHTQPDLSVAPRLLSNHGRVRFRGRLPGPRAVGRVVVLQASAVGSKRWITFRKATTRAHGRFHATYHFISTTRRTTYRFRAVVPVQDGYPWLAGRGKPVRVVVTP